ncbi:unnamed protein product [Caenorhabditis auriculariae]|uniref:Uncharacterized protein n=1 Tax=Caenorhabditis auriculariae TaxID=2777116 RepID=A0A8S1H6J1_9PELO|nr:unnamed protein product [Caenorhabditis auriculariae]
MRHVMIFIIFHHLLLAFVTGAVLPACQPPNNCSVHVFRVRLSQKPDGDELLDTSTITVIQQMKYGANAFEIHGGPKLNPEVTKEIMQNIPANMDPRLKEKIIKNEFYLKPVGPHDPEMPAATIPPALPPSSSSSPPTNARKGTYFSTEFTILVIILLICIGVILGIAFTALIIMVTDRRRGPTFDRSNAVVYKKSADLEGLMPMEQRTFPRMHIKRSAATHSATPSQSSSSRAPPWRHNIRREKQSTIRQISL